MSAQSDIELGESVLQKIRQLIRETHANSSLSPPEKARRIRHIIRSQGDLESSATSCSSGTSGCAGDCSGCIHHGHGNGSDYRQEQARYTIVAESDKVVSLHHPVESVAHPLSAYTHEANGAILGCEHYPRACKVVAPCCNKLFVCRFCHDEVTDDHKIDRYAIEQVVCMRCWTLQPFGETCIHCSRSFGRWNCAFCKFVDDTPNKQIFHCAECRMCRVGSSKPEDFTHCKTCEACVPIEHMCIPGRAKTNCPICFDDLFASIRPGSALYCGHILHLDCQQKYFEAGHERCPLCLKSVFSPEVADQYWNEVREWVEAQPMPPEFAHTEIDILCNDCCRTNRVKFNFYGIQCPEQQCNSFNTNQLNCHNWPHY